MKTKIICFGKEYNSIKSLANEYNLSDKILYSRLNRGFTPEEVVKLDVEKFLIDNNIKYIKQKRFKECKNKRSLPFDFYLPIYNICIEVDGEQHFDKNRVFAYGINKEKEFELRNELDNIKNQYCKDNNIKLLRIPYWEFDKENTYQKSILNILNI